MQVDTRPQPVHNAPSRPLKPGYRADIEGLRAVAVTLVVLAHAGFATFAGGFVGVDVFFVISGFLITGILLREGDRTGSVSIVGFYARRARRILPAAALVLVTVALLARPIMGEVAARTVYDDGSWAAGFLANFRFMAQQTDYFAATQDPSPFQHFWSLAVEEQFYLLWPLLILVAFRVSRGRGRKVAAIAMAAVVVASLAWSVVQTGDNRTVAYFSPLTRAWELGVGALLAVAAARFAHLRRLWAQAAGWVGLALIAFAVLTFDERTAFPGLAALVPVVGAALVIAAGISSADHAPGVLTVPGMELVGKLSYSWYLWHWPVLVLAHARLGHDLSPNLRFQLALLSLLLAGITYVLLEDPVRRFRKLKDGRTALVAGALVAALVVMFVGLAGAAERRAAETVDQLSVTADPGGTEGPARLPDWVDPTRTQESVERAIRQAGGPLSQQSRDYVGVAAQDSGHRAMGSANCLLDNVEAWSGTLETCVYGDKGADRLVVLFGDSHAAMWQPALDLLGRIHHFRVVVVTRGSCPVAKVTAWDGEAGKPFTVCDEFRAQVVEALVAAQPEAIVLSSNHEPLVAPGGGPQLGGYEDVWRQGMEETLRDLRPSGAKLVVLGDLPRLEEDGPVCLSRHLDDPTACATALSEARIPPGHEDAERVPAVAAGATYVSMMPLLCSEESCPAVIDDEVVYADRYHLSGRYVVSLAPLLERWLGL